MRRTALAIAAITLALLAPCLPAVAVTDHKAPVIRGASLSRERVDVTLQDRRIRARVRITDNTGVDYVQVYLVDHDDNPVLILTNPAERVSGTRRDGVYEARATIPRHFKSGQFRLWVDASDGYGNSANRVYDGVSVHVVDRDEDVVKPRLRVLAPANDSRFNVRRRAVVVPVRLRGLDDKSGIDVIDVCLVRPNTPSRLPQFCADADQIRGTRRDGIWEARIRIPRMALGGVWNVDATVTDRAHPYDRWYWQGPELFEQNQEQYPDGAFREFFQLPHGKGRVRIRGSVDRHPPVISKVAVSPTELTEGVGGTVTFRAWATDPEGVSGIYAYAAQAESGMDLGSVELQLVRGTRRDGVWKGTLTVPATVAPGTYSVGFNVWDRAHYVYYREDGAVEGAQPVPGPDHIVVQPAP